MHPVGLIFGLLAIGTVLLDAFETIILPRRASGKIRLTRLFYVLTWGPWSAVVSRFQNRRMRETGFSFYGPLSLLFLMALWAAGLVFGFGLIFYGLGAPLHDPMGLHPLRTGIYISGTTLFTLGIGDVIPLNHWARDLVIIEAGTGLGFVAVVIGYLPVLYQAFSRREGSIALLDARAGIAADGQRAAAPPRERRRQRGTGHAAGGVGALVSGDAGEPHFVSATVLFSLAARQPELVERGDRDPGHVRGAAVDRGLYGVPAGEADLCDGAAYGGGFAAGV